MQMQARMVGALEVLRAADLGAVVVCYSTTEPLSRLRAS